MLKLLFQVLSMASPLSEEQSPNLVLCYTMILLIYLACISTQSGISFTFFVAKTLVLPMHFIPPFYTSMLLTMVPIFLFYLKDSYLYFNTQLK